MSIFSQKPFVIFAISILLLTLTTPGGQHPKDTLFKQQPAANVVTSSSTSVSTSLTYQGNLTDNGGPANGEYYFRFRIFNALSGGTLVAGPIFNANVSVNDGLFTAALDFGRSSTAPPYGWKSGAGPGTALGRTPT